MSEVTINALAEKYKITLAELDDLRSQVRNRQNELSVITQAIRLFDSGFDVSSLKPKKKRKNSGYFKHGTALILVREIFRDAGSPITTREIQDEALIRKGLVFNDEEKTKFDASIFTILHRMFKNNEIIEVSRDRSGLITWELV